MNKKFDCTLIGWAWPCLAHPWIRHWLYGSGYFNFAAKVPSQSCSCAFSVLISLHFLSFFLKMFLLFLCKFTPSYILFHPHLRSYIPQTTGMIMSTWVLNTLRRMVQEFSNIRFDPEGTIAHTVQWFLHTIQHRHYSVAVPLSLKVNQQTLFHFCIMIKCNMLVNNF